MKLGLAQFGSGTDGERNLSIIRSMAADARRAGAEIVAVPEYAMYEKKMVDASFAEAAEELDGAFVSGIASIAAEYGVTIVAGMVERSSNGDPRPFNTLIAIDSDGRRLAAYRKIHLFDSYGFQESAFIQPAPTPEPVVFDAAGTRVGLLACYDLRFPELARALVDAGAEVLLVCSSWVPGAGKVDQWRILAQARAIENTVYTVAVSQTPPISVGHSLAVDPSGRIITELHAEQAVAVVDVHSSVIADARERDPALLRRRYDVAPRRLG